MHTAFLCTALLLPVASSAATNHGTTDPEPAALPALAAPPAADDLWSRLRLQADARVRGESTFDQLNGVDRHRGRLRFRFGGEYDLTETLRAGARFTTLSDGRDANNPHWDFGDGSDGFSASEVGMDRLYLDWQAYPELKMTAGKFGHVFTRPPVTRELAWDDDVQPAGAAVVWAPKLDGSVDYDLRAIHVVAAEVNSSGGSGADPAMSGIQANLYLKPSEKTRAQIATSYSKWSGIGAFADFPGQGSTADAEGFGIWDSYASLTFNGWERGPVTTYAQFIENTEDESGEDTGYAFGVQVGHTSGKGRANVFAAWYSLDANAVFGPVAQDDTPIAGTGNGEGMEGIVAGVQYFITDNLSVRLWGLTSDVDADDDPYRVRLDFDFRIR